MSNTNIQHQTNYVLHLFRGESRLVVWTHVLRDVHVFSKEDKVDSWGISHEQAQRGAKWTQSDNAVTNHGSHLYSLFPSTSELCFRYSPESNNFTLGGKKMINIQLSLSIQFGWSNWTELEVWFILTTIIMIIIIIMSLAGALWYM